MAKVYRVDDVIQDSISFSSFRDAPLGAGPESILPVSAFWC
jgi:hypothetical protein